ncbi:leucine-rich repeat and calponin homology domain-containing protein 1 [Protopterus annectens]|uniref:leucine-rich repeat and calponin homology domain-containing protein 1 n=1 Tax=Protopterus annectens TaxID=7888 RepID=UPI001CFAA527|nr:leucine-rich repeat and calponin homology domain-containing protein 1 [Protopterus annectens]
MATLAMDYQSQPQLASTTAHTPHSLNYSLNVPLNRGLERALEEGANSGVLNLSGRKLKDFPRFAFNYDLSDTVEADLSKNRLTEVPVDICEFVSLETLNLYHNCIKVIPDAIINLQTLTYLNIVCFDVLLLFASSKSKINVKMQPSFLILNPSSLTQCIPHFTGLNPELHIMLNTVSRSFDPLPNFRYQQKEELYQNHKDSTYHQKSLFIHLYQNHEDSTYNQKTLYSLVNKQCFLVVSLNLIGNICLFPEVLHSVLAQGTIQAVPAAQVSLNLIGNICLFPEVLHSVLAQGTIQAVPAAQDVSCNEITALPHQIGQLKSLRELNIRRNYIEGLPEELAELPLVKFDVSCNKLFSVPISFTRMAQLHSLVLDNNPLQSPPAQICTKGKVHIFKYLSAEASRMHKTTGSLYLPPIENPSLQRHTDGSTEDIYPAKKDSDSGVGSDSGDKRLSAIEPSDEEAVSQNMPMKNIMEEEQYHMDEGNKLVSPVSGSSTPVLAVVANNNNSSEERCRTFVEEQEGLSSKFNNYIKASLKCSQMHSLTPESARLNVRDENMKRSFDLTDRLLNRGYGIREIIAAHGRMTEFDEPLRIEEDTSWMTDIRNTSQRAGLNANEVILGHSRETVNILQDPNRNTINVKSSCDVKPCSADETSAATLELENSALNGEAHQETSAHEVQNSLNSIEEQNVEGNNSSDESEDKSPDGSPSVTSTAPFGLKPRCGFLRSQRNVESVDPQFTIRRKMEQLREELEMLEQLRENIETRLKTELPRDMQGLGTALMDGVVLCHLVNYIRPRSVASIHVPSPAVPKLSMAKCRRNVENFLDACRKMGVPEDKLCLPHHILEEKGLVKVSVTVQALVDVTIVKRTLFT